jgi:hypothetical protein
MRGDIIMNDPQVEVGSPTDETPPGRRVVKPKPLRVIVRFVDRPMTPERRAAGDRAWSAILERFLVREKDNVP